MPVAAEIRTGALVASGLEAGTTVVEAGALEGGIVKADIQADRERQWGLGQWIRSRASRRREQSCNHPRQRSLPPQAVIIPCLGLTRRRGRAGRSNNRN